MFNRKKWEKTRPALARGSGLGEAADAYGTSCTDPARFGSYDEFVSARLAAIALQKALDVATGKLARHPSREASDLVTAGEKECEFYLKMLGKEYTSRVQKTQDLVDEFGQMVSAEEKVVQKHVKQSIKINRLIADEINLVRADRPCETEKDDAKGALGLFKKTREESAADFSKFRNTISSHPVRSTGVAGICTNHGVGGPEKASLINTFNQLFKRFSALEIQIDDALMQQEQTVLSLKTLIALLSQRKNATHKQITIFAATSKTLAKIYTAMDNLKSKPARINGSANERAANDYPTRLSFAETEGELVSVGGFIEAYTARRDQLQSLDAKAEQIINDLIRSVPDSVKDNVTVSAMVSDLNKKWIPAHQDNQTHIGSLNTNIDRGEELVKMLLAHKKQISK